MERIRGQVDMIDGLMGRLETSTAAESDEVLVKLEGGLTTLVSKLSNMQATLGRISGQSSTQEGDDIVERHSLHQI